MELFIHIKGRWQLRDKCLSRLNELIDDVEIFLRDNKYKLVVQFYDEKKLDIKVVFVIADRCIWLSQRNESVFVRP